jgi:hypothetical protein
MASRLARLDQAIQPTHQTAIQKAAGGESLTELRAALLDSIDRDVNLRLAVAKFKVPTGREPSEEQLIQVEQEQLAKAIKPFRDPKLQEAILAARRSLDQVHTEGTPDQHILDGEDEQPRFSDQSRPQVRTIGCGQHYRTQET